MENCRNFLPLSLIRQWKRRKLKKKAEKCLLRNVINSKTLETRKKKHTTNNVKTAQNLRNLETPKRKFLKRRFPKKTLTVRDKSVTAKRKESATS